MFHQVMLDRLIFRVYFPLYKPFETFHPRLSVAKVLVVGLVKKLLHKNLPLQLNKNIPGDISSVNHVLYV